MVTLRGILWLCLAYFCRDMATIKKDAAPMRMMQVRNFTWDCRQNLIMVTQSSRITL
jgi:hypothetical protein